MSKLLIADDDKMNRILLSKLMQKLGAECSLAENGQEALDIALTGNFDAVLLDINMPFIQGPDCAEKIRADFADRNEKPPVLVCISADNDFSDSPLFDYSLSKPFMSDDISQFLHAVEECCEDIKYDITQVSEIIGLDSETMLMLMEEFIAVMDEEILNLRDSVFAGDKEIITHVAHKMKGAAAGMMVLRLQELCASMQTAEKSDRNRIKLLLIQIICCYSKFRALFTS
ncbi:response regulator [Seleniivibrio woodruffii]|uniref:response regulator n=1 Tax=Seleniivibrio woodruffii TaxID=1078050 RepID=UPI0026EB7A58|nr:response regulator [Seleniivibrio woodruffii]